jgi:biotin synthase
MVCFEDIRSKILGGGTLTREEALFLLSLEGAEVFELSALANRLTRARFGDTVDTCSIANAKCGLCNENCSFCAQSSHHSANIKPYPMMPEEDLVGLAHLMEEAGANRFCIVTSGFALSQRELGSVLQTIKRIREETNLSLCTSIGHLTEKRAAMLREAGVTRIHHNLETSRRFFPQVCTTHTFEHRIHTVKVAKQLGFEVCCGGIIGLGETPADRVELALTLKELKVDAVPINIITPIAGTPLEETQPPTPLEVLKTLAVYRILLPEQEIRLAGGREANLRNLQSLALISGANGMLLGNYLTTEGQNPEVDLQMISDLGLQVKSVVCDV